MRNALAVSVLDLVSLRAGESRAAIVGSDATVKAGLEKLVGETGVDEVIVVTDTYEPADRLQSYQPVAGIAAMIGVTPVVAVRI
jgi:hypothetical protein